MGWSDTTLGFNCQSLLMSILMSCCPWLSERAHEKKVLFGVGFFWNGLSTSATGRNSLIGFDNGPLLYRRDENQRSTNGFKSSVFFLVSTNREITYCAWSCKLQHGEAPRGSEDGAKRALHITPSCLCEYVVPMVSVGVLLCSTTPRAPWNSWFWQFDACSLRSGWHKTIRFENSTLPRGCSAPARVHRWLGVLSFQSCGNVRP
jgi:hypothetical protein